MSMNDRVAIIGAGWAGCASAVEAIDNGFDVTLFEASRIPGGRARKTVIEGMTLDNGQHILLGAYSKTLQMMAQVGIDTDAAFLRLPLQMHYPPLSGAMNFETPRLPAPLHLAVGLFKTKGLAWEDKIALARFFTACRHIRWDIGTDRPLVRLLEQFWQTPRLYGLLWRPLCMASMNTTPEKASAQVFLSILKDSLGARRHASDMLLPKMDLSAIFPEKAIDHLTRHGGKIRMGETVRELDHDETGWTVNGDGNQRYDAVIVATSAAGAASLLKDKIDVSLLSQFEFEPISTCYLKYPESVRLDRPFYALTDNPDKKEWGQYVFDRGHLMHDQPGLLAVVVSVSSAVDEADKGTLDADIARQLAKAFKRPELEKPLWSRIITEKRATFSCTPGLERPAAVTEKNGLFLAGDYLRKDYPATLESAISSGIACAKILSKRQLK
ncbi:hydroxysqualene dehydroxylase HpnE [Oxalobacter formigenes]|nr:hydroxysqualene dehydroxylase HpnE [Oxalobacter formigenes]ARQ45933.1 hypothetical protein BRW83_1188 [Oxalobacter formigenes]